MIEQYLSFAGLASIDNGRGSNGKGYQVDFKTPGTFQWTVPADVFKISVVAISAGARGTVQANVGAAQGGRGGCVRWQNDIVVTPGDVHTIVVGSGGVAEFIPVNVANSIQTDYATKAFGLNVGITVAETTPKSASVGGGNGSNGQVGNSQGNWFQGGDAGQFTADTTTQTNPARGTSLLGLWVNGSSNNGGICGGGGSARSYDTQPRAVGKGGDGGVRIIWGRDRAFPNTKITDMP